DRGSARPWGGGTPPLPRRGTALDRRRRGRLGRRAGGDCLTGRTDRGAPDDRSLGQHLPVSVLPTARRRPPSTGGRPTPRSPVPPRPSVFRRWRRLHAVTRDRGGPHAAGRDCRAPGRRPLGTREKLPGDGGDSRRTEGHVARAL